MDLRRVFFSRRRGYRTVAFLLVGLLAVGVYALAVRIPDSSVPGWVLDARRRAVQIALDGRQAVLKARRAQGLEVNPGDRFATGLIGVASSPVTTELGSLPSHRTATDPVFAAAVVQMLYEAGVRRGDVVAVGMTGSYPGFDVDAYAAIEAVGASPVVISSLASSQYGANEIGFTWTDMERVLERAGVVRHRSIAVAPGGSLIGHDQAVRRHLAEQSGIQVVPVLPPSEEIRFREHLYVKATNALHRPIRAFVNVGGSQANVGSGEAIVRPGLSHPRWTPFQAAHLGVAGWMAVRGIPIISLSDVPKLASMFGVPWDPHLQAHEGDLPAPPANPIGLAVALVVIVAVVVSMHRLGFFRVPNWELPPGLERGMRRPSLAAEPSPDPAPPGGNGASRDAVRLGDRDA